MESTVAIEGRTDGGPPSASGAKVLVAEDHPTTLKIMSAWLAMAGYEVLSARDGQEAWEIAQRDEPTIVVTDWNMPNMTGIELCRAIRQKSQRHQVYLLIATARDDRNDLIQAMQAGADDFLTKPIDETELLARIRQAEYALKRFRRQADLAETDPLTGLMNRRSLTEQCEREIARAARYDIPLSCALMDVDLFKFINDTFGHAVGDTSLCAVANTVRCQVRKGDYVSRYGGDEFCLLLPETDEENAVRLAERIRSAVADRTVTADERTVPLRITIGVAQWRSDVSSAQELFDLADQALLTAKQAGRNRVVRYTDLDDMTILGNAGEDTHRRMLEAVVARDIMSTPVVCLNQSEPLRDAADLFLRLRITSAPVVDRDWKLVGMISERELLNATVSLADWQSPIREAMRSDVARYREDEPVVKIWEFLRRVTTRRVVIVRDQTPVGVISRGSLLRWLGNWGMLRCDTLQYGAWDEPREDLEERMRYLAMKLAGEIDQFQSDIGRPDEGLIPTVINVATRLQEHAQHMLALCQVDYRFNPEHAASPCELVAAGSESE